MRRLALVLAFASACTPAARPPAEHPTVARVAPPAASPPAPAPAAAPDLPLPRPEVEAPSVRVDLPTVPDFAVPPVSSDGTHTVRELRVARDRWIDQDVAVAGVVTFAYDCVTDVRKPGESAAHAQHRIDQDPTLCQRPKFFVGDTADTPLEQSLWVVDVPRPYNRLELANLPKPDRTAPDRCEPHARGVCPPYKVGDHVLVVGRFALASPHSESNSDGLIVYHAMRNVTAKWETADGVAIPKTPPGAPPAALPAAAATSPVPPAAAVADDVAQRSLAAFARANRSFALGQLADAETAYHEAIAAWPDNHVAWYGLGGALAMAGDWHGAADAFGHATALRPDVAMYQLWLGAALYMADPHGTEDGFARSWQHLAAAVQLEPALWRAQYYIGKIHAARGEDRRAAEAFSRAIAAAPARGALYVALANLYLRWDYTDQALAVSQQGTVNATDKDAKSIWFLLGRGYDDKRLTTQAIDAYSKALDLDSLDGQALFQRGADYAQLHQDANARRDLEAYLATDASTHDMQATMVARRLLLDLAARAAHHGH